MDKRLSYFKLFAYFCVSYILYALVINYIVDPGAETFLNHKTDPTRELKASAWLMVLYIHIAFACVAMASGLVGFWTRSDEKHQRLHRLNGYVYVSSVLLVVLTSGYMAPYATGGTISSIGFNLLNLIWLAITTAAIVHIRKKHVPQHRRWMIRSYAFCFTNMLIHLLTFVLHGMIGITYATSYTLGLYGTIILLLAAPELILRMKSNHKSIL
jgi:Predicted membrane protein